MEEISIHKKWFKDYMNPTDKELKLWMEDSDSFEPEQDWDIIIGDVSRLLTFVRLANNEGPQREDIVHYLYVSTASAFNCDRDKILEAVSLVPEDAFSDLLKWKKKSVVVVGSTEFISSS